MMWPKDAVGQEIAPGALITYAVRKGSTMELRPARVIEVVDTGTGWALQVRALIRGWRYVRGGDAEVSFRARTVTLTQMKYVTVTGLRGDDAVLTAGAKDAAGGPDAARAH